MELVRGWNVRKNSIGDKGGLYFYDVATENLADFTCKVNEDTIRQWDNPNDIADSRKEVTQDFFADWLRPTDSERTLFELEFGIRYVEQSLLDKYSSTA